MSELLSPKWTFEQVPPGVVERNPVSEEFFANDTRLESVIRESIQNSLDARADVNQPVEVRIYFSGDKDKLSASRFEKYWNEGEGRFNDSDNGLTRPIPSKKDDCTFLVIEDFNTTGLTGPTDEKPRIEKPEYRNDWNYYNYFFRENGSTKTDGSTLGSWGSGKCVFQRASRLKVSFAYSIRNGYMPQKFLVGKATLKNNQDENGVTWSPDGWFGLLAEYDSQRPNKMLKCPIVDEKFLSTFCEDFNLVRKEECGTSIVIPYVHLVKKGEKSGAEFNQHNLIRSVLRNFLVALYKDDLVVKIKVGKEGHETTISKATFQEFASFLPSVEDKDAVVTSLHQSLIIETLSESLPEGQIFTLKMSDPTFKWTKDLFEDEQLEKMQRILHARKLCCVKVPVSVFKKVEGTDEIIKEQACFRVAIKRMELKKSLSPVFFRAGLLIDAASNVKLNAYIAAVIIENDALAKLLVAAEPPSHNKWNYDSDRVVKGYDKPRSHIQYVTTAVKNILDIIASSNREANWDPLSSIFGISKPKGKDPSGTGTTEPETPPPSGEDDPEDPPTLEEKGRIISISEINNATDTGLRIFSDKGLEKRADYEFPLKTTFVVGYDTLRGLSWSPNDFDFSTGSGGVKIKLESGNVEIFACGNKVTLTIKDKTPFVFSLTGFDKNRDLNVDKLRTVANKQEEVDDGISI